MELNRKEIVGNRLRSARNKKGLSQEEVANQIDIITSGNTLAMWERGERLPRDKRVYKRLAALYEVPTFYLEGVEMEPDIEALILKYMQSDNRGKSNIQRTAELESAASEPALGDAS